ncbi:MAG: hypothetical protein V4718_04595 [Pseudomonadota bacterium]
MAKNPTTHGDAPGARKRNIAPADATGAEEPKKARGAPPKPPELHKIRTNVMLMQTHLDKAALLGDGNVSKGIQRALDAAKPPRA